MHKHNFEDDHTGPIWGFICTKCKKFEFWLANVKDDCSVADKEPYWDDTDYSKLSNDQIRQILSNGNRDSGAKR